MRRTTFTFANIVCNAEMGIKMKIKKESDYQIFRHCIQLINKADPKGLLLDCLAVIPRQAAGFFNIYLAAQVITAVTKGQDAKKVIWLAAAVCAADFICNTLARIIKRRQECHTFSLKQNMERLLWEKVMNMDYAHIENVDTHIKFSQAQYGVVRITVMRRNIILVFTGIVNSLLSLILVLPVLSGTPTQTKGFIGFVQSWQAIVLLLILIVITQYLQQRFVGKQEFKIVDSTNQSREVLMGGRIRRFYMNFVFEKYQNGKDIRIYDEAELILKENKDAGRMVEKNWRAAGKNIWKYECLTVVLQFIPEFIVIAFGIIRVMTGMLAVGEIILFIMYFSKLLRGLSNITGGMIGVNLNLPNGKAVLEFLDIPEQKYQGTLRVEKRGNNEYEFEFRHVSFHYPDTKEDVLKDINLKWHIGEKMALVGRNGSGKSTLIKLLCRLYNPTEGEILLNGTDIRKYNYEEYMALFSVVFQDSSVFSFSMAENVAASVDYDAEKVEDCVQRSGLSKLLDTAKEGINTCLYQQFDENGIEISGGEAQKLALARAIYKNAPFVVLDEPTAALDPVSEHEIYTKFNTIVGTETAVYISHRLSSCRFCNDIIVLKDGRIAERGSHEMLLRKNGEYALMWQAQAEYYKDSAAGLFA